MHMQHKVDPEDALRLPSFRSLYALTGLLGVLIVGHLLLVWTGYTGPRRPFGFVDLALFAALIGGARIVYGALLALFEGTVGADLALAIAVLAALVLREYWVGAEVVFIAMVGESLEAITFSRTHREIRRILELQPRTAHVMRGESTIDVPVAELLVGDRVVVRPGERIPIDGTVLTGQSAVDQSTLTGESLPIDKAAGDQVFAGTLNQFGAIEARVDKLSEDTTLAQVIHLVSDAQENKAPLERVADRFARMFLPAVLLCALGTLIITNWRAASWSDINWMPTLAVLVVACPCALVLATPAAIMAALAWLAKRGVLIKGGVALERLASVNTLAFDKTGTLTQGKLQLGDVITFGAEGRDQVLTLAAAAEQRSEHPIARLIVAEATRAQLATPPIAQFTAHHGAGVVAELLSDHATAAPDAAPVDPSAANKRTIAVGNRRLLEQQGIAIPLDVEAAFAQLDNTGQTSLAVAMGGSVVGLIGARDTIRPEAADVLHELRHLGIDDIVLLTGDRRPAAESVARAVGIDHFEAELLPQEKAAWIQRWRDTRRDERRAWNGIGMVGDGVNDAPALASADVGLALGGVGSDIAAEAGDLILMGDPLTPLPGLVRLSRATVRVIRQNIVLFAFGVNAVAIGLAAAQKLGPVGAAIYHQIGSFLVLVNAMRLLWFEYWERSPLGRFESIGAGIAQRVEGFFAPVFDAVEWLGRRRRGLRWTLAGVLAAGYACLGLTAIGTDEIGIAQRCGRFVSSLEPGLHWRLPPPWERVAKFAPDRVRVAEIGFRSKANASSDEGRAVEWNSPHREGLIERIEEEALVFTGDENLLELNAVVQFSVQRDPKALARYLFASRDPDDMVKALAEGILRELAAQRSFWSILTVERSHIEEEATKRLQEQADSFDLGVAIRSVALQDVHPPLPVVRDFHDVSSAHKDRERMQKEADAYFRQQIIAAAGREAAEILSNNPSGIDDVLWQALQRNLSGEAASEVLRAKGSKAERVNRASGEASGFRLRLSAHAGEPALSELRLYLDTVQATLANKEKTILDPSAAGRRQLFLANPEKFNLGAPAVLSAPTPPRRGSEDEEQE
jgi:Cu+-exporting ATPase